MTSALALVVALSWNTFVSQFFEEYLGPKERKSWARFLYAMIITLVTALIVTVIATPTYGGGALVVRK